jgi:hypothetical protein
MIIGRTGTVTHDDHLHVVPRLQERHQFGVKEVIVQRGRDDNPQSN